MNHSTRRQPGFTLVELLVVISIIGVLAAMLLPAISRAKIKGKEAVARTEMSAIVAAIEQYRSDYSRFPASAQAEKSITDAKAARPDFTFGTVNAIGQVLAKNREGQPIVIRNGPGTIAYDNSNAEVMAILLAVERDGNSDATVNVNNARNPRKTVYLSPKMVDGTNPGGVGKDLVYRDPFGNPYIITMDLNYDDRCRDAFYRMAAVSQGPNRTGLNGLSPADGPDTDTFEAKTPVMVWSLGFDPDANKDNLLSWK